MLSNAETNDLIRRFETTMNERRLDDLDDLLAPDVVRHCEATPGFVIENIDQFKDFLRADTSVFPDNKQTFEHMDHVGQHGDPGPARTPARLAPTPSAVQVLYTDRPRC